MDAVGQFSDFVRALLARRGIDTPEAIASFLEPDYATQTHSPMLLEGMERALARLFAVLAGNERIAVYADFDCDGIPGAALLSDFFTKIEYANFEVYLPHRDREGYGFHMSAIDELAARGVSLIITVDVGTTSLDAVAHAKKKGVDVIVTDHHEITGPLPDAVAVLNPKLGAYPFPHLCGAAMAFKFAQAALQEGKRRGIERFMNIPDGWEKWLLDMVAIATVADMVPLVGENRVLAYWGLSVLRKSPRPGINALCNATRMRKHEITEDDIGFSIAPRINAASRMDEPMAAFQLLTTKDPREAEQLAAHLEKLNARRKGVVGGIVREARKHVKVRYAADERVVVVGNTEWKPALLGLAANSIMEERGGVVCLWGRDVNGNLKGSCRSDGGVSITDLFANADDVLEEYGGHSASGGFSVSHEQVHTLGEAFTRAAGAVAPAALAAVREPDLHISLSNVSRPLFTEVSRMAPFGMGNPKPLFHIAGCVVVDVRRFGKEGNHVEVSLECRTTGARARAFDFFRAPEDFSHAPAQGAEARVLATIERDSFRGGLALRIVDILPAA
jgi:single-stranded-DNA-specific exonuclease